MTVLNRLLRSQLENEICIILVVYQTLTVPAEIKELF